MFNKKEANILQIDMQYVSYVKAYVNVPKIVVIKLCKEIPKSSRVGLRSGTLLPFFIT